jgi:AcrR family transcriptional regulator
MAAAVAPAAPAGLRERKKVELKRRLAAATLELVRARGYEQTTIDEIVRRVEVSQPTFYKYYPSKDAVLREHALHGFTSLFVETFVPGSREAIVDQLRRYFRAIAAQMTADRELWYAIAVSNAYNPIRDPELLRSAAAGTRALEAVLAEGQRRGELTTAYTAVRLASTLEGIIFRICIEWGAGFPKPHALAGAIDEGFDLFLRAAKKEKNDARRDHRSELGHRRGARARARRR